MGILAKLTHPNLVRFCGVCLDPPLVVMEYYRNGSMFKMLECARAAVSQGRTNKVSSRAVQCMAGTPSRIPGHWCPLVYRIPTVTGSAGRARFAFVFVCAPSSSTSSNLLDLKSTTHAQTACTLAAAPLCCRTQDMTCTCFPTALLPCGFSNPVTLCLLACLLACACVCPPPQYVNYLSWKRRLQMLHDVASGMLYLHSRRYVHGDLRSPNLFVTENGRVRGADAGDSVAA